MYLTETTRIGANGTAYRWVLLRQSYREGGQVKNRTMANLSHCPPQEVAAIRLALQYKDDLTVLSPLKDATELQEGRSGGAVWVIDATARRLGIATALGTDFAGKLALWQVIARVMDQGSRLSAVRLAQTHAACEGLQLSRGVDEDDLSDNLAWLTDHQATIERRWFTARRGAWKPALFLYDVTRSYLEGQWNALAAFGDNRDGKAGKQHIVMGLWCAEDGAPVSPEVFAGHTPDLKTLAPHMAKVARRFGGDRVTFVGDRGMSTSGQMAARARAGFHDITAVTTPQIERLLKAGVLHLALLTAQGCAVEHAGLRSLLRRHPLRAEERAGGRRDTPRVVEPWVAQKHVYLHDHPRAQVAVALRELQRKRKRLKIAGWLTGEADGRTLCVTVDGAAPQEAARLDGCSGLQTDLPRPVADTAVVHERYQDLA